MPRHNARLRSTAFDATMFPMTEVAFQRCIAASCSARYGIEEVLFSCPKCGSLLDVHYDWDRAEVPGSLATFASRWATCGRSTEARADYSGVWRFRELLPFAPLEKLVTLGEGRTTLQQADSLATTIGMKSKSLFLQYEGFNPSGSFKDNGMAAAFTVARLLGKRRVACASTGNTSASMALFSRHARSNDGIPLEAIVFVGGGKIAFGKLAQALDFGAKTLQIEGDFDTCMKLVRDAAQALDLYLMNSVNPFRLEGQKTIMYRVLEGLDWQVPDWIVVPGGNLGNTSAFGKAFVELNYLGLVDRIPRIVIVNAAGANTFCTLVNEHGLRWNDGQWDRPCVDDYQCRMNKANYEAHTVASAIEIGRPVNLTKALRTLDAMDGIVRQVTDNEILDAKALVGAHGYGCEPASAASVAGLRLLLKEKVISPSDRVVCILTGHALKDASTTVDYHCAKTSVGCFVNAPIQCPTNIDAIAKTLNAGDRR